MLRFSTYDNGWILHNLAISHSAVPSDNHLSRVRRCVKIRLPKYTYVFVSAFIKQTKASLIGFRVNNYIHCARPETLSIHCGSIHKYTNARKYIHIFIQTQCVFFWNMMLAHSADGSAVHRNHVMCTLWADGLCLWIQWLPARLSKGNRATRPAIVLLLCTSVLLPIFIYIVWDKFAGSCAFLTWY